MNVNDLCQPRPGHGLQAMMLRWEARHPVNAMQIAWLNRSVAMGTACAAADRVFRRLVPGSLQSLFDFSYQPFVGDWRAVLEDAVTDELNRPYDGASPPWRLTLFESPRDGQFLALGYRHVIADARSTVLLLHEIVRQMLAPSTRLKGFEAEIRRESLHDLYPAEFRWGHLPSRIGRNLAELWASRRAFRAPCSDPGDLHMEFGIHQVDLTPAELKATARRYDATVNDLLFAAILEWLARRYPLSDRGRRPDLSVAVLADLSSRGDCPVPRAFGQYLSQFAIRLPVAAEMPFGEIVGHAARCSQAAKRICRLIDAAHAFEALSKFWDWLPVMRRQTFLPAFIPLLAGLSNVHVGSIVSDPLLQTAIRSYLRGTCVTNLLPMMLSLTTVGDHCTLTTTHRPTVFSREEMKDLAAHVGDRLASPARISLPVAA
jgi:hypothetical protein